MLYKFFRPFFVLILAIGALTISAPQPVRAAGPWYVSTTGADSNDCLSPGTACATINGAISKASSGDTINIAIGTYTSTAFEVVMIDRDITLVGGWDEIFGTQSGMSTIDGQHTKRGVMINSGIIVSLDRFIVENGFTTSYGGGIFSYGDLTITNSSIHSNSITPFCYGGGIFFNGLVLAIENTTIANNSAGCNGGGLFSAQIPSTVTINNSTISHNNGGGVLNNGTIILKNTIISGNTVEDCSGVPFTSEGNNIIGNTTNCQITAGPDDQFNVDPQLGPFLADRGYHPLLSSSPAINAGNPTSCLPTDQRGLARDTACDIGAFEYTTPGAAESLSVAGGNDQQTTTSTAFPTPLQVAALDNQGNLVSGVTIDFTAPSSGPSGTFADTGDNTNSVATDANGIATTSVFTANDQPGVYTVTASAAGLGSVNFSMEQILRPANDNFAGAEVITSLPFNVTVDNTNATTEPGEPQGCSFGYRSVWFVFTPSETMVIQMDMMGSMVGGITDIYLASGSGISDLTFSTCTTTSNSINFSFEAGTTYYLRVDSFEQTSSLQVNLQQITTLPNDNFANAEIISSLPINITVDNTNASFESGEPQGCSSVFRSVWYAFTPSENMTLRVDMAGSVISGNISILLASGPEISDLTFVACASSGNSPNFQVEAGRTYYLRVDSSFGQPGSLQVNLQQITPPSNDNFANAEVITSLPFNVTIDNTNATTEPNEPMLGCSFLFRNIWYTFTPSENMAVQVDMMGSAVGGTVNILLASGPAFSDLTSVACASTGNSINYNFEAGKTYYLQVDSFGQPGSLQVNLQRITPPANDNFIDAALISSLPFNVTVDNTNATFEPGEPQNCSSPFRSVWYVFTPSENMTVRADMQGSAVWGITGIYAASGPGISDLTFLTCASSGGSSASFQVEVGKTYYLRVDSSGQAGSLQFNLVQAIPPENDNFASPEAITALPFNDTVDLTNAGLETNEPQNCYGMQKTVWYSFIPSETMTVRMDTQGSAIGAGLNLYQPYGSGISEQNFLGCTAFTGSTTFLAEAGQTYYIQAGNIYGQDGTIQINVNQVIPPTNDNFANTQAISSLPFNATVNITDATTESSEPQYCYFMNKTIWYSFTPTETIKVRADMQGSAISGNMNIYRAGTGISDLQYMQCATPGTVTTFLAEAGQTYYIQAGPAYGENGTLQINLAEVATITGRVTDAVTGNSVPNAYVYLHRVCGDGCLEYVNTQQADSRGRFYFDSYYYGTPLPIGTYQIEITAYLYETKQFGPFEFSNTNLHLGDIPLNPPSIIRGRTVDASSNNVIPGAYVTLYRCNGSDCTEYINYQYTDGDGLFQFNSFYNGAPLTGGTYELEFAVHLYETKRIQVMVGIGENFNAGDVHIVHLPSIGSIRGRLIDSNTGQPIAPAFTPSLQMYRCENGSCYEYVNSLVPDAQGRFNFNTDNAGNLLTVGTYQITGYADQYNSSQTAQFTVGAGENRNLGNIRLTSLPVRFSEIQACAEIPASGGDCVYSVKVTNGMATTLSGTAWSLVNSSLPDAFAGYTEFQARESKELDLAPGKSKVLQFRFLAPANNSSYGTYACARMFVGEGGNSIFNTVGYRDLFCVVRNAAGYAVASPQEAMALTQENVATAATETDIEPNNSCQAAQDVGTVSQRFTLDGDLDSSLNPDVDFFRFTGTPGLLATIDLEGQGTGKGTLSDPYLGFFDSNCNLIALNDDSGGYLNSRLEITIPADGVFVLAATRCCDSGFYGTYGGGSATYQLTITPVQYIGSISGRATDAFTQKPLRGDIAPFAFVRLLRCETYGCFDVAGQNAGSDGRFLFETDSNGALLRTGNYLVVVSANQYHPSETDQFTVNEGENASTGDVALTSFPVRFSDTQACVVPTAGGICEFSVKITNGLSTKLTGKAWSMVNGYGIGSFINFTNFQTDTPLEIKLDPGKSSVLRFKFRVRGTVADGANICATVYVGQGPNALFNTVGQSYLFCFEKGSSGFTLMSVEETQATLQQLQIPEAVLPDMPVEKKK